MFDAGNCISLLTVETPLQPWKRAKFYSDFLPPTFNEQTWSITTMKTPLIFHGGIVVLRGVEPFLWNILLNNI